MTFIPLYVDCYKYLLIFVGNFARKIYYFVIIPQRHTTLLTIGEKRVEY